MYSRPHRPSEPPIHLPENYSGCAFSSSTDRNIQTPPTVTNLATKKELPITEKQPPKPQDVLNNDITALFSGPLAMIGGIRFEELLLIGLIILLARTDQGSDVILWLALLLFCK